MDQVTIHYGDVYDTCLILNLSSCLVLPSLGHSHYRFQKLYVLRPIVPNPDSTEVRFVVVSLFDLHIKHISGL